MATGKKAIEEGKAVLGIELGSTRIKAVLIGPDYEVLASGGYDWENRYENGIWTYDLEEVWRGLQGCYRELVQNVRQTHGIELQKVASIGISGMMHGYLAFDQERNQLAPFRTWRNTTATEAAKELTGLFSYNIPERWSIAHLYQSILNREKHVGRIASLTTLAGYVHDRLTGEHCLGMDDASGMFPIDPATGDYRKDLIEKFDLLVDGKYPWKLRQILPVVKKAGAEAGLLTGEGALLLDPTGGLQAGCVLAPPEGDAGTGMVATNSVGVRTGNVSAGTSIFGMFVLEKELKKVYPEIDLVATPDGDAVAMVHANNCTSDINAYVNLFGEFASAIGADLTKNQLYETLFRAALEGDADCGGLLSYGYLSGEFITDCREGRPLFVRGADSRMNLANFMRMHLYSALATLRIGMDILEKEEVKIDTIYGHGGYFKTEGVGQQFLAAALRAPVSVMKTAGEGGAWGAAILAAYRLRKKPDETLQSFLTNEVFQHCESSTQTPQKENVEGFRKFMEAYAKGLPIEREAARCLREKEVGE